MANDKVYLDQKGIFIGSTSIRIGSFTYQIKNITSYRRLRGAGTIFTVAPILLGLVVVALGVPTKDPMVIGCGIALGLAGVALLVASETLYLMTSAGQVRAFSTRNKALMNEMVAGLDQAMADNSR